MATLFRTALFNTAIVVAAVSAAIAICEGWTYLPLKVRHDTRLDLSRSLPDATRAGSDLPSRRNTLRAHFASYYALVYQLCHERCRIGLGLVNTDLRDVQNQHLPALDGSVNGSQKGNVRNNASPTQSPRFPRPGLPAWDRDFRTFVQTTHCEES